MKLNFQERIKSQNAHESKEEKKIRKIEPYWREERKKTHTKQMRNVNKIMNTNTNTNTNVIIISWRLLFWNEERLIWGTCISKVSSVQWIWFTWLWESFAASFGLFCRLSFLWLPYLSKLPIECWIFNPLWYTLKMFTQPRLVFGEFVFFSCCCCHFINNIII